MRLVVAGGTGLIGSYLLRRLTKEGHSVTLLIRKAGGPGHAFGSEVVTVPWDGKTKGDWITSLEGADGVINLSGESIGAGRWTRKRKERIIASRVDACEAISSAIGLARNRPKVLVNASGAGYYGHVPEGEVTEDHPPGNDFLATTCLRWEAAARQAEQHGTRVVMIRTAFVLASNAPAFKKMTLPFKLFAGGPYGSGRQWFPWVHIDDIVGAYLFAVQHHDLRGPVNAAAPDQRRIEEFTALLGKLMKRPAWAPAPSFALRIILGEMADLLLKGQKLSPRKIQDAGYTFRFESAEEALHDVLSR